ncbi:hypothetical protein ACIBL8_47865 [Streptomyces sp. NPDC050523]|uniref:hypothetical protein n=1 Tax=Streptomyces sp. NPDC050523 TaxID=3365622 RepID=UPI0037A5FD07
MTTRDDLHRLVDQIPATNLETTASVLRQLVSRGFLTKAPQLPVLKEPPYPRSVGILTEAPADLSTNVDDYLADGFGQ